MGLTKKIIKERILRIKIAMGSQMVHEISKNDLEQLLSCTINIEHLTAVLKSHNIKFRKKENKVQLNVEGTIFNVGPEMYDKQ